MAFLRTQGKSRPITGKAVSIRWVSVLTIVAGLTGCDDGSGSGGMLDSVRVGPGVLKGTISIEPGSRIDRDTALGIVEEGPSTARGNPQNADAPFFGAVTLGGFVSATEGEYNRNFSYPLDEVDSYIPLDEVDSYILDLAEGDRVGVDAFALQDDPQFSIQLFDSEDAAVDANEDDESSFTVAETGEYRLRIEALSGGPVRYLVRQRPSLASASTADFVPGEALITLQSQGSGDQIRAQSQAPISTQSQRALGSGRMQVRMPDQAQLGPLSAPSRKATREWIEELRQTPGIDSATPNYRVEQAVVSGAEAPTGRDWHHQLINAEQARPDATGDNVRIAILDTGAYREGGDWHPGLAPNINCSVSGVGCFDAVDEGTLPTDDDVDFHGTHVAGIASAASENEDGLDNGHLQGVAYNSFLVPVRVLAGGEGSLADVIAGVNWVVNPDGEPRADVINLSLGGPSPSPALKSALAEAETAGILVVAAAGNNANEELFFPAAYPQVLSVGSVTCQGERSGFSSFGDWLALAAPGGGDANSCTSTSSIYSTSGNDDYAELRGTSMASPQLAATLALMIEAYGRDGLSPRVVRAMIREGRLSAPTDGSFDFETGRGVLDVSQAMQADPAGFAALKPNREQVRLNRSEPRVAIEFESVGASADFQQLQVSLTEDVDWLAEPIRESDRTFSFALDEPASGRSYSTTVAVSYEVNGEPRAYELPVSASIDDLDLLAAGIHFVQLIPADVFEGDGDTLSAAIEKEVRVENGEYRFEMDVSELERGRYYLLAGSDLDNDGVLGQPGEAYGIFTDNSGAPEAIDVSRGMNRTVSFETGFLKPEDFRVAKQSQRKHLQE